MIFFIDPCDLSKCSPVLYKTYKYKETTAKMQAPARQDLNKVPHINASEFVIFI